MNGCVLRSLQLRPRAPKRGVSGPSFGNSARADDEPLGRGAYKIEGVTGHQSENVVVATIQHFSLFGLDHFGRVHAITKGSAQRRQRNFIIYSDLSQPSEKRVPVSCKRDVPLLTRQRSAPNMPDCPSQSPFFGAFQNHRYQADGADLDSPQRRAFTDSDARAFGSRKVRFLQRSFKAPGLFSLIEPRVEQREADVTQRQKANDQ